jgi:hypothetical protein
MARSMAPPDCGWQWHERGLGALADHPQHTVSVFLAEVDDGRAGGFEDPQAEHYHQREVAVVDGLPGGGEQHRRRSEPILILNVVVKLELTLHS